MIKEHYRDAFFHSQTRLDSSANPIGILSTYTTSPRFPTNLSVIFAYNIAGKYPFKGNDADLPEFSKGKPYDPPSIISTHSETFSRRKYIR